MRLKLTWMVMLFFTALQLSFAQEKTVKGTVKDASGVELPGVAVQIKGEQRGTETDFDGNYSLQVAPGKILVFSYLGMKNVEKTVGNSNTINVVMEEDTHQLGEVVVTGAMGLQRKPKELSYSVSSVKSKDLTAANSANTATAMIGKVSGLQINVVNNGVSPSTRVVLRGNRSLLNNNQALIVVDGFPAQRGVLDRINPEDIEETTVLKGANASALYGSEAANGVLIITTKKGRSKLNVTLNSTLEMEEVSYMPQFQDQFGSGGFPDGTKVGLENVAWGPRFDGELIDASEKYKNGDVWMIPYSPIKDNHRSFFSKGLTFRNGVTISAGDDKSDLLFSVDFIKKNGVVPKDEYGRNNVRLNAGRKLGKFEFKGNFSFYNSNTNIVSSAAGKQGRPIYWNVINTPLHIPIKQMKNWKDGYYTRKEVSFYRFYENPYYLIDNERDESKYNEFTFIGDVKYNFTNWLSATYRAGYTFDNYVFKRKKAAYTMAFIVPDAYHNADTYEASTSDQISISNRFNSDFILSLDKNIGEFFNLQANLGHNVRMDNSNSISVSGDNLIVPDFYNVSTRAGELGGGQSTGNYRKIGVFADVTLGIKKWLFLNASARNDWSSSLSADNRSYFYPGGGVSVVLSDAIPQLVTDNGLSYLKLSGNITQSGNDPSPYVNQGVFAAASGFPYGSIAGLTQSSREVSTDLRPEFTLAKEAGLEFGLFKNRVTGNITLYQTNTYDQIIPVNISYASGASSILTNLGELENKGIEVDLNATLLKATDFKWDVGVNYSGYTSKVLELSPGVEELSIGGYADASIVAKKGAAYPQIKVSAYERDDMGRVIVDDTGDPVKSSEMKYAGKTTPDYVVGLNSSIAYKNFKLYVTADYRAGSVFYNNLAAGMEFTGLSPHSVTAGRKPFVFPNSSYSDGKGGYIANTDRLTSNGGNAFWDKYSDVKENYVYDGSFIKIREISLSYDFNTDVLKKIGINNLSMAVYARNPFMFRPKDNVLTDPEFNYSTGNIIGIGTDGQTPPTRLYGFKLTANF
ncbi:SusC/RagA family TonB-linked outer membrane protein [Capnocytophaga canimorsus]|uniref:SusC/RagA family TonB-linked outer membrane protein n=1 Tax=Capnocytophaga canimorsus TaxID=28188 RepID=UPI0037CDEC4A